MTHRRAGAAMTAGVWISAGGWGTPPLIKPAATCRETPRVGGEYFTPAPIWV